MQVNMHEEQPAQRPSGSRQATKDRSGSTVKFTHAELVDMFGAQDHYRRTRCQRRHD